MSAPNSFPSVDFGEPRHCVAGMHIGGMWPTPSLGDVESVLTLAAQPETVGDGIKHKHLPISYLNLDALRLWEAMTWVDQQLQAERRVLVRSEVGLQRPALVVAGVCVRWGATITDALLAVRRARPNALTDFRYIAELTGLWNATHAPRQPNDDAPH